MQLIAGHISSPVALYRQLYPVRAPRDDHAFALETDLLSATDRAMLNIRQLLQNRNCCSMLVYAGRRQRLIRDPNQTQISGQVAAGAGATSQRGPITIEADCDEGHSIT
jgi:hypothetical protein